MYIVQPHFFPSVHYFSKLSLRLTEFLVSKILQSIKLWLLLLQGSWKCFSVALYCHKSLKDRETNFYAQLLYPKCSWDISFLTPLPFHQKVRTMLTFICDQVWDQSPEEYILNHIFTVPLSTLTLFYFPTSSWQLKDTIHFFCFHLRAGNQDFQSNLCSLQSVFWQEGWNPQFSYDSATLDFWNRCTAKIFQTIQIFGDQE